MLNSYLAINNAMQSSRNNCGTGRKVLILFLCFCYAQMATLFAQTSSNFNYQAAVRDSTGMPVANQAVSVKFSIREGGASGPIAYAETHNTATNVLGLLNLAIGSGSVLSGDFSAIDWNNPPYFLETAIDENGGTNYQVIGVDELLSVPYALNRVWDVNGSNAVIINPNVGIGTNNPVTLGDIAGELKIGNTGIACNSTIEGSLRYNYTNQEMEYCNGTAWTSMSCCTTSAPPPYAYLPSCKAILDAGQSTGSGTYTIDPDGSGGMAPINCYCDMSTSGGGWTRLTDVVAGTVLNTTSSTNREYLFTKSSGWYRSPMSSKVWNWNSGQQLTGTYHYSGGSFNCSGSGEQNLYGVGCSNGPGGTWKCLIYYNSGKDPANAKVQLCQDQPGIFGGACQTGVTVYIREQ